MLLLLTTSLTLFTYGVLAADFHNELQFGVGVNPAIALAHSGDHQFNPIILGDETHAQYGFNEFHAQPVVLGDESHVLLGHQAPVHVSHPAPVRYNVVKYEEPPEIEIPSQCCDDSTPLKPKEVDPLCCHYRCKPGQLLKNAIANCKCCRMLARGTAISSRPGLRFNGQYWYEA